MSVFSIILGSVVFVYTVTYTVYRLLPIYRYRRANKTGDIKIVDGEIVSLSTEVKKAYRGEMVSVSVPVYSFEIDGIVHKQSSVVQRANIAVGESVKVAFCERTGEAWAIKDLPLMKKNLIIRVTTILAVLTVLVLTEMLL